MALNINYEIGIYKTSNDNKLRFVLGKNGENTLVVIGLNPSKANEETPDHTMRKVMGFAGGSGYDSFIMLNLYPQRSTDKNLMDLEINDDYHQANLQAIEEVLKDKKNINVLVAFGNDILLRKYLKQCFMDIVTIVEKSKANWLQIGDLTKAGHPRHPSLAAWQDLNKMDMNEYLLSLR